MGAIYGRMAFDAAGARTRPHRTCSPTKRLLAPAWDDPELVTLDTRRRSAFDQVVECDDADTSIQSRREESRRCKEAYLARLRHLRGAHVPVVSLDALPQLVTVARSRGGGD